MDSCVPTTRFEVMLAPQPIDPSSDEASKPCLQVQLAIDPRWTHVTYVTYLGAVLAPLSLTVEQNTVTRLLRLHKTITARLEAIEAAQAHAQAVSGGGAEGGAIGGEGAGADGSIGGGAALDDATAAESSSPLLHIKEMQLEAVLLTVTLSIAPLVDEPGLQPFHPTAALRNPVFKQLTSLQNVTLSLNAVEREDAQLDLDTLISSVTYLYLQSAALQLHRMLGSLDAIGNPAAMFADVRGGVKTFFREPRRGALRSPKAFGRGVVRGVGGLAGGVGGGVVGGAMGVFSAGFRAVNLAATGLSSDEQFAHRRQLASQQKAGGLKQGLKMGAEALRDGMTSGITGLVKAPAMGAAKHGAGGAVVGLGQGLLGVGTKTIAGVAGFASKVTEGIGSEARKLTPGAREADTRARLQMLRARQPRLLVDGVVRPYPRRPLLQVVEADELDISERQE